MLLDKAEKRKLHASPNSNLKPIKPMQVPYSIQKSYHNALVLLANHSKPKTTENGRSFQSKSLTKKEKVGEIYNSKGSSFVLTKKHSNSQERPLSRKSSGSIQALLRKPLGDSFKSKTPYMSKLVSRKHSYADHKLRELKNASITEAIAPTNVVNVNVILPAKVIKCTNLLEENNLLSQNVPPRDSPLHIIKRVGIKSVCTTSKNSLFNSHKNSVDCSILQAKHLITISKYSYYTKLGYLPDNPNKVNQDSFILHPKLSNISLRHFFGVADGHGQNGREVSTMIKEKLPSI